MLLLSSVISSVVQLGLFLVIPFAWWAFTARRSVGFASWIGLRWPTWDGRRALLGVAMVIGAASTALLQSLSGDVPAARFAGRGLGGLVPVLLFAIVQTSLAEEIFFRGFLGKRVIARWGFAPGNAAQAIAFGILHVAMFVSFADPIRLLAIGILTGASGWIVGWLNEEGAGGSILPGWALHASANLLVGTAAAFNLMG
nr:CPBP family intramembrane glutamic endopeptidase [Schaalia odontolytica]